MTALTDYLDAAMDAGDLSDPSAIASAMLSRIPARERAALLAEVLPGWVKLTLSRRRMLTPLGEPVGPGSSKVAAVRSDWAARLATPLCVAGVWRRLADCTADDLRAVAADLRGRAQALRSKADWYDDLAEHVPAGATVGSLDADPMGVAA